MAPRAGRDVTLNWNGTELLGVRQKGISFNGDAMDVTSEDDAGWRTLIDNIVGEMSVEISVSGVVKDDVLKKDYFNQTRTRAATLTYPDGSVLSGTFNLGSYSEGEPYKDASTFDAKLMSNGPVTYTPYA